MTWLETIATGFEGASYLINKSMATSLAFQGLGQGLSGRQMLRSLRSMGLHIRTQDFYRAVRAAKAMQGSAALVGANPPQPSAPITDYLFEGNTAEGASKYMSVVTVHYNQEVEGETVALTKDIFVRSTDVLTQGQVVQRAYNVWTQLQSDEKYPLGAPTALEYVGTSTQ